MKKIVASLGAAGVALVAAVVVASILVYTVLVGGMTAVVGGSLGGVFADKHIQEQYCLFGTVATHGEVLGEATPMQGSQADYLKAVYGVAKDRNLPKRAAIIATMVMFQESGIKNYANDGQNARGFSLPPPGNAYWLGVAKTSMKYPHDAVGHDADSVGLFQQRPSAGWGDGGGITARSNPEAVIKRLMDPKWGANAFFGGEGAPANRGLTDVPGWQALSLTVASQRVQGSAFPSAYSKWEGQATSLVNKYWDEASASGGTTSGGTTSGGTTSGGTTAAVGTVGTGTKSEDNNGVTFPLPKGTYASSSNYGPRPSQIAGTGTFHTGQDYSAPPGTNILAAAGGVVRAAGAVDAGYGHWIVIDHTIDGKRVSTLSGHMYGDGVLVKVGQQVNKGDVIGKVGADGKATGPHLHFEVWEGGRFNGGHHIDPVPWLAKQHASTVDGSAATQNGGLCPDASGATTGGGSEVTGDGTFASVFAEGKKWIGTPYSFGGGTVNGPSVGRTSPAGFDCSSLVQYMVYNGTGKGLMLPRIANAQYAFTAGNKVDRKDLQPGDLLFWGTTAANIHHVAMYIGNGNMIEAPRTGAFVRIVPVYYSGFYGATRISYA